MEPVQSIKLNGQTFAVIGNVCLLDFRLTALLCSRKCPADKILEAYDQFKEWAANPVTTVISGFHSPIEKECLRLLLRGKANIIFCPAREIEHLLVFREWKIALEEDRMLILSPFKEKRPDARTIERRNQLVADLADELHIPYASPSGNLGRICGEAST